MGVKTVAATSHCTLYVHMCTRVCVNINTYVCTIYIHKNVRNNSQRQTNDDNCARDWSRYIGTYVHIYKFMYILYAIIGTLVYFVYSNLYYM